MLKNRIAILLATFNGERRIQLLLNSILNQTCSDFIVYIHDDGSTDNTVSIVKGCHDKRVVLIDDSMTRRGAKGSFMWLLQNVEADYYMFCDQDDFWLPPKIQQSLDFIMSVESDNPGKPVCIHTDLAVSDAKYNVVSKSLWKQSKIKPDILENKNYIQVFNCVTGCTMMFNNRAKECAFPFNENAPMHDFWVAYQTMVHNGILTHLPVSTMLYCQHGNNTVGANDVGFRYVRNKIKGIFDVVKHNRETFMIMHKISGISWLRYMWCKVSYEIIRII